MCTGLALIAWRHLSGRQAIRFLGAEWKQRGFEAGACINSCLILLLAFLFLTGTEAFYSRGTLVRPGGIRTTGSDSREGHALAGRRDSPETRATGLRQALSFGVSRGRNAATVSRAISRPGRKRYVGFISLSLTALISAQDDPA
jgi:hypothetical protein